MGYQIGALGYVTNTPDVRVVSAVPDSIAYLHSLSSTMQGDRYDLNNHRSLIKIQYADRSRIPILKEVVDVILEYK